jgi:hypothetical protein
MAVAFRASPFSSPAAARTSGALIDADAAGLLGGTIAAVLCNARGRARARHRRRARESRRK